MVLEKQAMVKPKLIIMGIETYPIILGWYKSMGKEKMEEFIQDTMEKINADRIVFYAGSKKVVIKRW